MDILALVQLLGGLFLGFGGIFGYEIMTATIGQLCLFGRIVYVLIGLSALYKLFELRAITRRWQCTLLPPHRLKVRRVKNSCY
jgi:uncharacterized membrane protein YuzA (DUF378 family)